MSLVGLLRFKRFFDNLVVDYFMGHPLHWEPMTN